MLTLASLQELTESASPVKNSSFAIKDEADESDATTKSTSTSCSTVTFYYDLSLPESPSATEAAVVNYLESHGIHMSHPSEKRCGWEKLPSFHLSTKTLLIGQPRKTSFLEKRFKKFSHSSKDVLVSAGNNSLNK